jgi:hypothetical protein
MNRPRALSQRLPGFVLTTLAVFLLVFPPPAHALDGFLSRFKDPTDGWFDTSQQLASKAGFMPVPIIITEPAVCCGGGLAIAYFHERPEEQLAAIQNSDGIFGLPPSITVAFGAGTSNGTWLAGGGHFASLREDTIRLTGGGGYGNINVTLWGGSKSLDFNFKAYVIDIEGKYRIPDTKLFVGLGYTYVGIEGSLESGALGLLPENTKDAISGFTLLTHWDGRDNIFNPNSGQEVKLEADLNATALGSSSNWQRFGVKARTYHTLHERVVLGVRMDGRFTWNGTPFYALPFVDLRGIPAMRYQGQYAGEGELELRVRAWKRFSVIGFVGAGWTKDGIGDGGDGPRWAGGGGVRYLLARRLGMHAGLDVARGPEQTAFYIQIGSAW